MRAFDDVVMAKPLPPGSGDVTCPAPCNTRVAVALRGDGLTALRLRTAGLAYETQPAVVVLLIGRDGIADVVTDLDLNTGEAIACRCRNGHHVSFQMPGVPVPRKSVATLSDPQ